ncbi:hypothetical protein MMC28_002834 [Mycoblastus sanguinarius]|nr:hypothetical protein [Mycoblastus sanguinarius]
MVLHGRSSWTTHSVTTFQIPRPYALPLARGISSHPFLRPTLSNRCNTKRVPKSPFIVKQQSASSKNPNRKDQQDYVASAYKAINKLSTGENIVGGLAVGFVVYAVQISPGWGALAFVGLGAVGSYWHLRRSLRRACYLINDIFRNEFQLGGGNIEALKHFLETRPRTRNQDEVVLTANRLAVLEALQRSKISWWRYPKVGYVSRKPKLVNNCVIKRWLWWILIEYWHSSDSPKPRVPGG